MATVAPWQAADHFISQHGRVPTAAEITATQAVMQQVEQAYEQILGRDADPAGLKHYTTEILSGRANTESGLKGIAAVEAHLQYAKPADLAAQAAAAARQP